MKVFVTGVAGQLGHDVMNELHKRSYEGVGTDIASVYSSVQDGSAVVTMPYVQMDITDTEVVERIITEVNPDVVIHCAAWTAVDMAEDDDKVEKVHAINAGGTKNIANACKKLDCKMVYISTDYVFDGQGIEPWQPDCKDYKPLNVYGQTKLGGELAVANTLDKYFIVRIAWVFGINGKNFIKTMLSVGKKYDVVRVVNDQIGTPTYTLDLARLLVDMVETEKYGYYHATNEGGYISWYDFTCEIFKQVEYTTKVVPVTTEEYGMSKAARPFNSRLDKRVLTDTVEFCYKCDDFYHANDEGGLAWNDSVIGIEWPQVVGEYKSSASAEGYTLADGIKLNLSDKDQKWLGLKDTFKF